MAKIVLISCVSKKLNQKSKAQDLYVSPLFQKNLRYTKLLNPDKIFILSAEYGLLDLNREIESKIISTVSLCEECKPSKNWLGNFSPKEKIRKSGLWLVNELWKTPLNDKEIVELKQLINIKLK